MTKDDIKIGLLIQSNDGRKKYKIIDVINESITYMSIIYGNNENKTIKMDKLLKNFKKIDE